MENWVALGRYGGKGSAKSAGARSQGRFEPWRTTRNLEAVIFLGAGLDREERLSRSDGYGSPSEPVADKTSGRAYQVFRRRDNGALCGSFDWRQPAHGDLILPQTAGSDRSAPE